jgi:uncharacterized protein (DUF849 family)
MSKLLVNLAVTGMIPTKKLTPHVPITADEVVDNVCECAAIGVNIVHLHARGEEEEPVWQTDFYEEVIPRIRKDFPDLIICVTCSGRKYNEFEKRSAVLDMEGAAKPDMASLTCSSLNFVQHESINSPTMIKQLARKMAEKGIKQELEIFDLGMVNFSKYLIKKGWVKPPYYYNILAGNIAGFQTTPVEIGAHLSTLPDNSIWSLAGLSAQQLSANTIAVASGGHIRVGLEDNIFYDQEKKVLATNKMLVRRILGIAEMFERQPASHKDAREILGL